MKRTVSRLIFGHRKKAGLPPGTVYYAGERQGPVTISALDYDQDRLTAESEVDVDRALSLAASQSVTWIDVNGIHDSEIVAALGTRLGLHPLVQEDIVSPRQRPKLERDGEHIYIVLRMLGFDETSRRVTTEQCSIVIGPAYVVTFQELPGDIFGPLRERIRSAGGRIRKRDAAYLGYAIIDAIIDHYFVVVDRVSEMMDALEEAVLSDGEADTRSGIHDIRRELMIIRRAVWPVREVLTAVEKMEDSPFGKDLVPFFRDASDHVNQVIESVELLREASTGLFDLYHFGLANRANEIVKVLTIMATIFIPLTFVAGIYGMNFKYMPELESPVGYPAVLFLMLVVAGIMLAFFRRKRWF